MDKPKNKNYLAVMGQVNLDDIYVQQVFDYYRQRFLKNESTQLFVHQSPRIPSQLREHGFICLCDRKLGLELDGQRSLEGGAIRGSMKRIGLFLTKGGELFRNRVVFPEVDERGYIVSATGYLYGKRIRAEQSAVIHWRRPDPEQYICQGMKLVEELTHAKAFH